MPLYSISFRYFKSKFYEYIDLVIDYLERVRPDLVLERFVSQSPTELLIAPDWGIKNYEFAVRMIQEFHRYHISTRPA